MPLEAPVTIATRSANFLVMVVFFPSGCSAYLTRLTALSDAVRASGSLSLTLRQDASQIPVIPWHTRVDSLLAESQPGARIPLCQAACASPGHQPNQFAKVAGK